MAADDTAATLSPAASEEIARSARRRVALRLLPFLFVLYVVAFIDRLNIGPAALEMPRDVGFSEDVVGTGAGIFFLGYLLLQIPGALIAERWSARRWIGRVMIAWGIITLLMACIHTKGEFYLVRFLLGAAEAGFFPAVVVYLSHWFRKRDRAKAMAVFYAAMPLSFVIGSPLGGVFLGISWFGMRGWRWLFVLEGLPAIVLGLVAIVYLTDWPREARWLAPEERGWVTAQLDEDRKAIHSVRRYSVWEALCHRDVILLTLCYFCAATGSYGIGFWLPTIFKLRSGKSDMTVTLLAALPYLAAFVTQQLNGWHSDHKQERRLHAAVPTLLAGASLFLAISLGSSLALSIFFFTLVAASYYAFQPIFWSMPNEFLSGAAAAASIGLINSVGNLGGFVGPKTLGFIVNRTHSFSAGLWYLVGNFVAAGILMLLVNTGRRSVARDP